ncbi:MAG: septum formation initiator family protein [Peptostreptococcaceae bacterium]|nr:septum formation initiator family protein [Peptostreptococcaceae bacterium]
MDNKFLHDREGFGNQPKSIEPVEQKNEVKKPKFSLSKILMMVALALVVYMGTVVVSRYFTLEEYAKEKVRVKVELENADKEIKDLQELIENAQNPEFIEKMARENLKMVRPEESVYIVVK